MLPSSRVTTLEAVQRETDPISGAQVWQLTSAPAIHTSIYMDVAYADASSRYIIYLRSKDSSGPVELWRHDLQTHRATLVCEGVSRWTGLTVSPDQRVLYCSRQPQPGRLEVIATDIVSLAATSVWFDIDPSHWLMECCANASPDGRSLVMSAWLGRPHRWGVLRFDLRDASWEVIHEGGDELIGGNALIDPCDGRDVLLQINRGAVCDEEHGVLVGVGEEGATLALLDIGGGRMQTLPIGTPYTGPCGGHQSWAGSSGRFVANVMMTSDPQTGREGSIAVMRPDDAAPRIIGYGFQACHCNASRDGRFYVTDAVPGARLHIGSIETGRDMPLCETGASLSIPQYTHSHPWLTPNNRWVVFTSDRTGVPHLYAAQVPEGLLGELAGGETAADD